MARERITYAERRLEQISEDQGAARRRSRELGREIAELQRSRARTAAELGEVRATAREAREATGRARERLRLARGTLAGVRGEERKLLRRLARLEGTVAASRARLDDLGSRLTRLSKRVASAEQELADLDRQGGASDDRMSRLQASAARARDKVDDALGGFEKARAARAKARAAEVEAADRASELATRRAALETMEREGAGYEPVVRAAREACRDLVLGTLSQCISGPAAALAAAESYLGHLAQALLVEDGEAAARLRRWFSAEWTEGGGIVLLPLDAAPQADPPGSLLEALQPEGPGAPWVRVLLAGVNQAKSLDSAGQDGAPGQDPSPASVDARGVLVVGNPAGTAGLLERRAKLAALEQAAATAAGEASRAHTAREAAQARAARAEEVLAACRADFTRAADDLRAERARHGAQAERRTRLEREKNDLEGRVRATRKAAAAAAGRARTEQEEHDGLAGRAATLRRRGEQAAEVVEVAEADWERTRMEEARLAILTNQHEGAQARADERLDDLGKAGELAASQIRRLEKEAKQLGRERTDARDLLAKGGKAVERLFLRRDKARARLSEDERALEEARKR